MQYAQAFIGGALMISRRRRVYYLHRQVLNSYYETGEFQRETVLLNEVAYEQSVTMAIADMLKKLLR